MTFLLVDKWLDDNNFQGNGHNQTDIGSVDMKQIPGTVEVCTRNTITSTSRWWLVLVMKQQLVQ